MASPYFLKSASGSNTFVLDRAVVQAGIEWFCCESDSTSNRSALPKKISFLKGQKNMLTHIVIWKYRGDVDQETRNEHVASLRRLAAIIPEAKSLEVGFDVLHLPRSYDTGLVAIFENRAGLDAYTVHPEHVKVADLGRRISEHVASVDFDS